MPAVAPYRRLRRGDFSNDAPFILEVLKPPARECFVERGSQTTLKAFEAIACVV
jgi:hypothetical protein